MAGELKHIKDFYIPVLRILQDKGGKANLEEICTAFQAGYGSMLDPSFFIEIKDGDIKWRDYINRAGYQLVKKGYINRGVARGVWVSSGKPIPDTF